jgi:Zn-dependent metalloprotease
MTKTATISTLFLVFVLSFSSFAEYNEPQVWEGEAADRLIPGTQMVREGVHSTLPSFIKFKNGREVNFEYFQTWVKENLKLSSDYGFELINVQTDKFGMSHHRYHQTYKGKVIENGDWVVHVKNGLVVSMNGNIYNDINLPSTPVLSEQDGLAMALSYVGADKYKWEDPQTEKWLKIEQKDPNATFFPKGEMVYANGDMVNFDSRKYKLAWKYNIYAESPLYRAEIYVDAVSGEIVWESNQIHNIDVPGTGESQYSGIVTIDVDSVGPNSFRLRETLRGNGIETYNLLQGTNYNNAVDFTDTNNYWDNYNSQEDEYAVDAHYGTEVTYDYFWNIHNRNSIDDNGFALYSYVHYSTNYTNAFWDGQRMTYGDGGGSYTPLTTLDICGHEVTHGLTTNTSSLVYSYESGALNESFSDIFGTTVEWYGDTVNNDWLIGEDILPNQSGAFRSMSDPPAKGDPDCYLGTNWYTGSGDNGGVHTNSGVQNKWFYILSEGQYSVTGIGIIDASRVAFRNNTVYLVSSSQYADARFYSIQAATDIFGACSPEVIATTDAWFEVCVGAAYSPPVVTASFTENVNCGLVSFTNTTGNVDNYYWDFGDNDTSTVQNPTHTYTQSGTYTVKLVADGACGSDSTTVQVTITLPQNPTTTDDTRCGPGVVNLGASGSGTLDWYDLQTGGTLVNSGTTYAPNIPSTTSYWVEDMLPGNTGFMGPQDNSFGAGAYYQGNRHLIFDVFTPCTLKSVKVYANSTANRTIEYRNSQGNVILDTTLSIPSGGPTTINLNFPLSPGTNYQLGILGNNNDMYRNSAGAVYPYNYNGIVSITGTNAPNTYYYFYYDWEIEEGSCSSAREEVIGTVNAVPVASFTQVINGMSVDFTSTSQNAVSYYWDFGDSQTSTQQNPTHIYTSGGTYNVMHVAISSSCGNDTTYLDNTVVGVEDIQNITSFSLYPNPASGSFSVNFTSSKKQDISIKLMSIIGQTIEEEVLKGYTGSYVKKFDTGGFATGVYMLRLKTGEGIINKRVVVR